MSEKVEQTGPRSFAVFLHNLADGDANRELSEELHDLIQGLAKDAYARNAASKGKLIAKFNVAVDPRGVVTIGWDVETREPKPPRTGGVMWLDGKGQLTAQNPKQQKLPLVEVNRSQRFADFDPDTGEVMAGEV